MNPDTPRTNGAKSYWDSAERENCVSIVLARELELEAVTYKNEALSLRDSHDLLYRDYQKLEAEVERLRAFETATAPEESTAEDSSVVQPAPDHFVDANKMIPEWRELGEAEVMDYCRKWAAEHLAGHGKETYYARLGLLVDFATDLYRDEIQKLKEAKP